MSSQIEKLSDAQIASVNILELNRLCQIATYSVFVYDILITIDQEVEFIWKARWSLGKALFLACRYLTLIEKTASTMALFYPSVTPIVSKTLDANVLPLCDRCTIWSDYQTFATFSLFMLTDTILIMRIYALYGESRKALVTMLVPLGLVFLISVWELTAFVLHTTMAAISLPGVPFRFCEIVALNGPTGDSWIYWGQILVFETILFLMVCVKAYRSYREEMLLADREGLAGSLMHVLIRDSMLYYLTIFAAYLACLVMSPIDGQRLSEVPTGSATAVSGIMSQRLILNLRSNYAKTCEFGTQRDFQLSTFHATLNDRGLNNSDAELDGSFPSDTIDMRPSDENTGALAPE